MRKAIRRLATWMGWSTSYHVAAQYNRDSQVGFSVISLTLNVSPWIHRDNYTKIVDFVGSRDEMMTGRPTITSITKLGA